MKSIVFSTALLCSLMACQSPSIDTNPVIEEADVSYIESDDDPVDVDQGDMPEANARLASTSTTIYFQTQSDDGNRYLKAWKVEDYFFGNVDPATLGSAPTMTDRKGSTYRLIQWTGTQYVKSKSVKAGYHYLRYVDVTSGVDTPTDIGLIVKAETGQKRVVQFDVSGGSNNYPLELTRLIRVSFDAPTIQKTGSGYSVNGRSNPNNEAFQSFVLANGENADNCNENADWYFDAEPESGKSCAVRAIGAQYQKMLLWSATTANKPVGRAVDLTTKKGVSFKFKPKKKGY